MCKSMNRLCKWVLLAVLATAAGCGSSGTASGPFLDEFFESYYDPVCDGGDW